MSAVAVLRLVFVKELGLSRGHATGGQQDWIDPPGEGARPERALAQWQYVTGVYEEKNESRPTLDEFGWPDTEGPPLRWTFL